MKKLKNEKVKNEKAKNKKSLRKATSAGFMYCCKWG